MIDTVVIPAAGYGTRMLPYSKSVPKEMVNIVNKPLIDYIVDECRHAGIKKFVFIINNTKSAIIDYFSVNHNLNNYLDDRSKKRDLDVLSMSCAREDEKFIYIIQDFPKGLGDAIYRAKEVIDSEFFAVALPDDLMMNQCGDLGMKVAVDAHKKTGSSIILVKAESDHDLGNYGVIGYDEHDNEIVKIKKIVEKPNPSNAPSNLCVIGRYVFHRSIFESISAVKPGKNGEIQITDAISEDVNFDGSYYGVRYSGERIDCGTPLGVIKANVKCGVLNNEIRQEILNMLNLIK